MSENYKEWSATLDILSDFAPDMMLFSGKHLNRDEKLPNAPGRIWYEADINYYVGRSRGVDRIVYSNDGLLFATYDHYKTFVEIILEG